MPKVVFVCASETANVPHRLKSLRGDSSEQVEILEPPSDARAEGALEWLAKIAPTTDFIVIAFAGLGTPLGEASAGNYLVLNAGQRSALPDRPTILVAFGSTEDRGRLPNDLRPFRSYDLSSDDGYESLLCRLVHPPLTRGLMQSTSGKKAWEASTGAFRVVMGLVATIVGNQDAMQDYLVANLGDAAWIVHYLMVATVLALVVTGLAALLRVAIEFVRPMIDSFQQPPAWIASRRWRPVVLGIAAVCSLAFAGVYLPRTPSIDSTLDKHLQEWSRRLAESGLPSGAFREHHDQGVGQAWLSAQALAGLLSARPGALPVEDYNRAFSFLQRARIGQFNLLVNTGTDLADRISPTLVSVDSARFPKQIPTLAFAYDMFALIGGGELPPREVDRLDAQRMEIFGGEFNDQGWGYFEQFDWGVTEIASWVGVALAQALRVGEPSVLLTGKDREIAKENLRNVVSLIRTRQIPGLGGFSPIADVSRADFVRTYSTTMALWALSEAASSELDVFDDAELKEIKRSMKDAVKWLGLSALPEGWKANPANPTKARPFLGLTAQTLFVLTNLRIPIDQTSERKFGDVLAHSIASSSAWARRPVDLNDRLHDADRYLFPTTYVTESSTFLWYPWTVALMRTLAEDTRAEHAERAKSARLVLEKLRARSGEFGNFANMEYNYVAAEGLIAYGWPVRKH